MLGDADHDGDDELVVYPQFVRRMTAEEAAAMAARLGEGGAIGRAIAIAGSASSTTARASRRQAQTKAKVHLFEGERRLVFITVVGNSACRRRILRRRCPGRGVLVQTDQAQAGMLFQQQGAVAATTEGGIDQQSIRTRDLLCRI